MPIQLTPIPTTSVGYPDGDLVQAAVTVERFGSFNAEASIDMNNDADGAEKQATWQRAVDGVESYFDARAKIYNLTADTDAAPGRMFGAGNAFYTRLRYLASLDMIPELYQARGVDDENVGPQGKMTKLRKEVRDELDEILEAIASNATETEGGVDGITVIGCPTNAACCTFGVIL